MRRTAFALLTTLALVVTGCSGDDEPEDQQSPQQDVQAEEPPLKTTARIGEVVGSLGKQDRRRVIDQVTEVVDDWFDAAYVGGNYPRSDFDGAFREFTPGAAKLADQQSRVMSNQDVGERVESVTAVRRTVDVDVLAPKGEPAGVTARVTLVIRLEGQVERRDRISGRLLLTPAEKGGGWQVFGFDVQRGEVKGR